MPLEVHIREDGSATVVEFVGRAGQLSSSGNAPRHRRLIKPGRQVVIDMSRLSQLSGTGLRMLLLLIRAVQAVGGAIAGAGVPQELRDIAAAARSSWSCSSEVRQSSPRSVPGLPPMARVDILPDPPPCRFALRPGFPLPFGATPVARGVNFAVYSRHATACTLVLFEPDVQASRSPKSRSRPSSASATCSP